MSMDSSYVKEMERLAKEGTFIEIEGKTFSSLNMKPVFFQPRPSPLCVKSLAAVRDYLLSNRDELVSKDLIIQVESAQKVVLMSKLYGEDRQRDKYLAAEFDGAVFAFGEWMSSEKFIIGLNALFLETADRQALLTYVASIRVTNESELIDSGVSQGAKVQRGVRGGVTETGAAPARVKLQPFRTFTEVEQPDSEFVFRMRTNRENGVDLAIFEADGGAWESVARARIATWLREALGQDFAILA